MANLIHVNSAALPERSPIPPRCYCGCLVALLPYMVDATGKVDLEGVFTFPQGEDVKANLEESLNKSFLHEEKPGQYTLSKEGALIIKS